MLGPDNQSVAAHGSGSAGPLGWRARCLERQDTHALRQHDQRLWLPAVEVAVEVAVGAVLRNMAQERQLWRLGVDHCMSRWHLLSRQHRRVNASVGIDLAGWLNRLAWRTV